MPDEVATAQNIAPVAQDQKSVEEARDLSLQARATGPGVWGSSGLLFYLTQAGSLIAPWWSRQRDLDLDRFWQGSDHLSGALGALISKVVSVPPHVEPRDTALKSHMRQADELNRVMVEESEFGGGWIDCASKGLLDYWSTDNGIFLEVIGDGKKNGPIVGQSRGLAHMDSHRCTRTGDADFPVTYWDTNGNVVAYHWTRVAFASDQPSPRTEVYGIGHCALGRCINVGQNLVDIGIYKQEKLGSRPIRGILLGKGVKTDVIVSSLEISQEIMDNQSLQRHAKLPVIGDLSPEAAIEILNLASLPDGFDEETSTKLGMFTIALAFGVPVRWIWPASAAGATKADAMYQHIAGLGGGIGKVLRVLTLMLSGDPRASHSERGKFLPPHLKLVFDFQDDEQDRMQAEIAEKRAKTRKENVEAGVFSVRVAREQALSDGDISQAQFAELELEDGRLPGGSDVLALFSSVDNTLLRLLDLGVNEPLAVHVNDPFMMLEEIDLAALLAQEALVNAGSRGEREKASQALAALGKLKTIYGPEAQRIVEEETALEMQVAMQQEAEAEGEVEGEEPEVAEGEKGFDFGVSVGEVISGQLARGAGGRFVNVEQLKAQLRAGILARRQQAGEAAESKPSAAAMKKAENRAEVAGKLGLPDGTMGMLLAMRAGGDLDSAALADAIRRGFVKMGADGQPYMSTLGRTVLGAGNAGNVDRARGAMAKQAEVTSNRERREREQQAKAAEREAKRQERERERETKRQQREAERERRAEDRERERLEAAAEREQEKQEQLQTNRSETAQALSARGVSELDFSALGAFRDGESLDAETAKRLAATGLVEIGPEGEARLTADGRAVATAADAGDIRRAQDRLSEGREAVGKTLETANDKTERASDAREKADDYRADADAYDSQADEYSADADERDAEVANLMAAGAEPDDIEKAQAQADKARERAERKREQAEDKRKRAAEKLEAARDYDEEARRLHDSVGGDAASAPEEAEPGPELEQDGGEGGETTPEVVEADTVTESEVEGVEVEGPDGEGELEVDGGEAEGTPEESEEKGLQAFISKRKARDAEREAAAAEKAQDQSRLRRALASAADAIRRAAGRVGLKQVASPSPVKLEQDIHLHLPEQQPATPPDITMNVEAQPAPQVTVEAPHVEVTVPEREVSVHVEAPAAPDVRVEVEATKIAMPQPQINVQVPAQAPPQIDVHVAAPEVLVQPTLTAQIEAMLKAPDEVVETETMVERDPGSGRISRTIKTSRRESS